MKEKEVVARKEYHDDCMDHLDFGLLIKVDGKYTVDHQEAEKLGIDEDDIATIQAHCDKGWKILPGEKHLYITGSYEGESYVGRRSIEISDLLDRNDLWFED